VITRQRQMELLGKWARVTNPLLESSWEGKLVGFADHPTLLLSAGDGRQIPLPQSFTIEVIDAPPDGGDDPGDSGTGEPRYTLAEARQELRRRECAGRGHDTEVICNGLSTDPVKVVCGRCGDSWAVLSRETA
jgi:hypothetical protein